MKSELNQPETLPFAFLLKVVCRSSTLELPFIYFTKKKMKTFLHLMLISLNNKNKLRNNIIL